MSQKINQLLIHVRQHLNLGEKESEQSLKDIENEIDDKAVQIRDLFARNLDTIVRHYLQHQEIITQQRKLESVCESFSQRIAKISGLSQYDEERMERNQREMVQLKAKKVELEKFQQKVRHLKRAALSIQEQRYNNAIKQLNLYRQNEPTIDTPLRKTGAIFNEQVKAHLVTLIQGFWESSRVKMLEIGTHCYNKVELSTHEKTNIYQAFFGRNSNTRNSMIRKSSIVEEGMGEAPLRFLKKINNEELLQKFILRINVEMNSLKQTRMLCKQMKEEELFADILNKQIRAVVGQIGREIPCENEADLKRLLSSYVGFLLFRREVVAFFNVEGEIKGVLAQMYSLIGEQAKNLVMKPENVNQIMSIKTSLDIFHKVLEIVDLDIKPSQYSTVLAEIFRIYCSFSLEQYELAIVEKIGEDSLICYKTQSDVEHKMIEQILRVKPAANGSYVFTSFVVYVMQIFDQYYDRLVAFVKDSELNKSQLHTHLSALFERIIAVYGGLLVTKDQPLQIAQGESNLHFCETMLTHFVYQLEFKHEYIRVAEPAYKPKLESVTIELRRRIREIVEEKIMIMMSSYEQHNVWLSEAANPEANGFVQWMLQFVKEVVGELRRTGNGADGEMAYAWMGHIAHLYWYYFQECREFTLVTVYNLDMDLLYIYKFIRQYFPNYPDIADKFKALSQFYALLLTNNIQEITDKQKRDIVYSHLDVQRIIPILKKYNKSKGNAGGKIRELKKKDIEAVVKKLEPEYK